MFKNCALKCKANTKRNNGRDVISFMNLKPSKISTDYESKTILSRFSRVANGKITGRLEEI